MKKKWVLVWVSYLKFVCFGYETQIQTQNPNTNFFGCDSHPKKFVHSHRVNVWYGDDFFVL